MARVVPISLIPKQEHVHQSPAQVIDGKEDTRLENPDFVPGQRLLAELLKEKTKTVQTNRGRTQSKIFTEHLAPSGRSGR